MSGRSKENDKAGGIRKLRADAEKKAPDIPEDLQGLSPAAAHKLLHELRVHQIELDMQNEELRTAQERLEESQAQYFELYDIAPVGYFSINEKGIILQANLTGADLLGVAPHELRAQRFNHLVCKEDQDIYYLHRKQLFETGAPQECEVRMVRMDGSLLWVLVEATLAQDGKNGKPICFATMSDVSLRKRAEVARQESEAQYRLLADYHRRLNEISVSLIEATDTQDLFQRIAVSFRLLTGAIASSFSVYNQELRDLKIVSLSIDPVSGNKVSSIFGPESFEMRMPVSADVMQQMLGEVIRRPKDLHELSFGAIPPDISDAVMDAVGCRQIVALAINYADELVGTCIAYLPGDQPVVPDEALKTYSYVSGVTVKRKRTDEALRESEEKYRLLVENAQEAIVILVDGKLKFANHRSEALTGYSQEELTAMPFIEFVHPADRQTVAERYIRRLQGLGVPNVYSLRIVCKPGDIKWAEASVTPITWEGKPATLYFLTDITDRRRLEEEQQRVAKLESVGLLAGGIAHDFNNILTAILGNISLAGMDAAPGSELSESLEQAEKASQRAKALTKQLLTFSRGGAPVTKLASLTDMLKDTAGFALRGSNVKCHFFIPDDLWQAEIDEGQVSQVIHNLVINAQQSMPAGGAIDLLAENMSLSKTQIQNRGLPLPEGDYIMITVIDHGSGIPLEYLVSIFDPFFTTKQKGSGLGLATSFSIARQHGGHISVESELGSGSTFYLYLPASREIIMPKQVKQVAGKPVGKARILVMDDEQEIRDIAGRMLKNIGYKDVEFAEDGAAAIKLYQAAMEEAKPFSVVIFDLTIPGGMGGEEAIKKLLSIDPAVKAIVSSGYVDDAVIAKYMEYGFSGMVAKPYTTGELRKVVQDVIG